MNIVDNVKSVDTWIRGLFIVVFGVIFYVLYLVLWLVVVVQFVLKLLTGELNQNLMPFSNGLTSYAFQILRYITFQSDVRPWPFNPWPELEKSSGGN